MVSSNHQNHRKPRFFFNIDTLGACNLKCPSCAVGNAAEKNPKGFMSVPMMEKIMEKADAECELEGVGLFAWTEPFLHPKLPDMIRVVNQYKIPCSLSSNLNIIKNIDGILSAQPDSLRISLSGFYQHSYGTTHRGGDIEVVKKNMQELSDSRDRVGAKTRIHVMYHRYLGNLDEEVLMREYAWSLGFEFQPVWAFLMPLEKVADYMEKGKKALSDEDQKLVERLAVPLEALPPILKRHEGKSCYLQTDQITMDFKADVQLCCAVYDSSKFTIGNYLELPLSEIQKRKYSHSMCDLCIKKGIHAYHTGVEDRFDEIAVQQLKEYYKTVDEKGVDFTRVPRPRVGDVSFNVGLRRAKHRLRKYPALRKIYRKIRYGE